MKCCHTFPFKENLWNDGRSSFFICCKLLLLLLLLLCQKKIKQDETECYTRASSWGSCSYHWLVMKNGSVSIILRSGNVVPCQPAEAILKWRRLKKNLKHQ